MARRPLHNNCLGARPWFLLESIGIVLAYGGLSCSCRMAACPARAVWRPVLLVPYGGLSCSCLACRPPFVMRCPQVRCPQVRCPLLSCTSAGQHSTCGQLTAVYELDGQGSTMRLPGQGVAGRGRRQGHGTALLPGSCGSCMPRHSAPAWIVRVMHATAQRSCLDRAGHDACLSASRMLHHASLIILLRASCVSQRCTHAAARLV
jgi:hypothetical protein